MPINCTPRSKPGGELVVKGCMKKYRIPGKERLPEEGHTLSPWVTVRFTKGGSTITVGNLSSPKNGNNAVIKSFDFGRSDGFTCKIVIQDQQGSSLIQFMEDMLKDSRCAKPDGLRMQVQFGWIKAGCDAPLPSASSPCFCMFPESIETNFQGGKFTYEITGRDLIYAMLEQSGDEIYGKDDNPKPLTVAIKEMMTDEKLKPTVSNVKFCRFEGDECSTPKFKNGGEEGPKGKWPMGNRSKIDAAREWLKNHMSDRDKGWKVSYNGDCDDKGEIIFWEDVKPNCNEGKDWESSCLGFYIVNGGKSSPVVEFNPRIKWDFARLTSQGGAAGGAKPLLNKDGKTKGRFDCDTLKRESAPSAGKTVSVTADETSQNIEREEAEDRTAESNDKAMKAEKIFHDNIEADLVIIGDPNMINPSLAAWAFNVSIAFINPFHLIGKISTVQQDISVDNEIGCGEWLAKPWCNEVLSNKAWIVKSISHSIQEGRYTTTLGLFLTTPGEDTDVGTPLGGEGSAGWKPPANC